MMPKSAFQTPVFSGRHIGPAYAQGAVLIVSLIFLLLLTILALSSARTSLLQEKMVGATRNAQLAMFGAETALRAAESQLWFAKPAGSPRFVNCTDSAGSCFKFDGEDTASTAFAFRTSTKWAGGLWDGSNGETVYSASDLTAATASAALARNPVYIIQDLGLERPPGVGNLRETGAPSGPDSVTGFENHVYRITVRSVGGNNNVERVLESTFAARSN